MYIFPLPVSFPTRKSSFFSSGEGPAGNLSGVVLVLSTAPAVTTAPNEITAAAINKRVLFILFFLSFAQRRGPTPPPPALECLLGGRAPFIHFCPPRLSAPPPP